MKNFHKTKHSLFLTAVAIETGNKDFLEIGGELPKENCEIDTFSGWLLWYKFYFDYIHC